MDGIRNRVRGLDGIRGLSVLAVVLTHLHVYRWLTENGVLSRSVVVAIDGVAGVTAFFVLSGFLITLLLVGEQRRAGVVDIRRFFMRRVLRIVPVYTLFLVAAALLFVTLKTGINGTALIYAALYITNFIPPADYSSNLGHTWSLAVEMHFYLVWPFIFYWLRQRLGMLCLALVAFIVLSAVLRYLLPALFDLNVALFSRWTFIAGSTIAIGCLLALLLAGGDQRWRTWLGSTGALVGGLVLWFSSLVPYLPDVVLRPIGMGLLIGWLFLNQGGLVARVLEFRPLRYLGTISYGVYLYQGLFLATGPNKWFPSPQWPLPWWAGLVLLCVVAPLSYRYLERPIQQRWGSRAGSLGGQGLAPTGGLHRGVWHRACRQ